MDETSIVILVTIITTVLPALWAVFGWLARRSWRPVLRGLGLALVPIGLLVTGLMRLLVRALTLVVSWFAHTQMTTTIWTGVIVAAIGLLTWIGAGFMTPLTREEARQRRAEHRERRAAGAAGKPLHLPLGPLGPLRSLRQEPTRPDGPRPHPLRPVDPGCHLRTRNSRRSSRIAESEPLTTCRPRAPWR